MIGSFSVLARHDRFVLGQISHYPAKDLHAHVFIKLDDLHAESCTYYPLITHVIPTMMIEKFNYQPIDCCEVVNCTFCPRGKE